MECKTCGNPMVMGKIDKSTDNWKRIYTCLYCGDEIKKDIFNPKAGK